MNGRGAWILLFAAACSGRSAPPPPAVTAEATPASPTTAGPTDQGEAPTPEPRLVTLEPAEHGSATRPSSWPCQAVREVPGDTAVQVRTRFRYEGPAECQTPPDLHLVACPTRAEVRNTLSQARSHDITFEYAADGRMASYRVTSMDGERTLSSATLFYDEQTERLARVEESHELRDPRAYEWLSAGAVRVTEEGGLANSSWTHRRDAEGRPTTAERVIGVNVVERHAFVAAGAASPDAAATVVTRFLATCAES